MTEREAKLEKMVEELGIKVLQLTARLEQVENENAFLRKQLYGPKSERPTGEVQFVMGELFAQAEEEQSTESPETEDDEEPEPEGGSNQTNGTKGRRKKRKASRLPLINTGLEEREEIIFPQDPASAINPETGEPYPILRYEETRRLAEQAAQLYVLIMKRPVYIKDIDKETGATTLITTPVPDNNPIDRCKADVSLLTSILIYKYMWHLPLYRLQEIFHSTSDMWLPRSTMCGWITGCAVALEPIVKLMRVEMMKQKLIGLDDTSVCQLAPGEGKVAVCKLWAYTCVLDTAPYVVYDHTPNREARHPLAFIDAKFNGYIQGDAYSGHHEVMHRPGVKGVGCWDHARRYFTDASANDPKLCGQALFWIAQLYQVERVAKAEGLKADQIKDLRAGKSAPVLDELKKWADETIKDPFLKEGMRKALGYMINQWEMLTRYLEDGDIPISNIHTERAMRGVGVGRKNWLFTGSDSGGNNLAIILSIITTCRVNNIDVRKYLDDVLRRVNTHPNHRLEELLPDRWAALKEAEGENVRVTQRQEWRKEVDLRVA